MGDRPVRAWSWWCEIDQTILEAGRWGGVDQYVLGSQEMGNRPVWVSAW